jgi:hypothetical protein
MLSASFAALKVGYGARRYAGHALQVFLRERTLSSQLPESRAVYFRTHL